MVFWGIAEAHKLQDLKIVKVKNEKACQQTLRRVPLCVKTIIDG